MLVLSAALLVPVIAALAGPITSMSTRTTWAAVEQLGDALFCIAKVEKEPTVYELPSPEAIGGSDETALFPPCETQGDPRDVLRNG